MEILASGCVPVMPDVGETFNHSLAHHNKEPEEHAILVGGFRRGKIIWSSASLSGLCERNVFSQGVNFQFQTHRHFWILGFHQLGRAKVCVYLFIAIDCRNRGQVQ